MLHLYIQHKMAWEIMILRLTLTKSVFFDIYPLLLWFDFDEDLPVLFSNKHLDPCLGFFRFLILDYLWVGIQNEIGQYFTLELLFYIAGDL